MLSGSNVQGAVKDLAFPLWQRATAFGVGFWICAQTSQHLSIPIFSYVSFWLPAGLYVAVLLFVEIRTWHWFMLAALIANALYDLPHGSSFGAFLGFYLASTVQAVIGAWLMRSVVTPRPTLENLNEFLGFIIFISGIGAMAGALVGGATLVWTGMRHSFLGAWQTWAVNTSLATLLLTPFILVWFQPPVRWRPPFKNRSKIVEAIILLTLLTGYTYYLLVVDSGIEVPYKSRLMPILLWAGLRFGLRGATATILWLALWMAFLTTHYMRGLSPDQIASGSYVRVLQSFLAMSVLMAMVPTIVLVQRDKNLRQMEGSEKRFRRLFGSAADALFFFDDEGRIVDVNEAACKMHGYSREELLRLSVPDVKARLGPEERDQLWKRIRSKSSFKVENLHRRKDGSVFPVEISVSPLDSEGQHFLIAAVRDITERNAAEIALRGSEERFRLLWNQSADGIRLTNADGAVIMANPAYCRLMRLPAEAVEGRPMSEVYLPANRSDILAKHRANFASRSVKPRVETQVTLWNGEAIWLDVSNSFMENDGSEPLLLALFRDITERKRAELELLTEKALSDSVINGLPGIFYMFDIRGKLLRWNAEFAKVIGGPDGETQSHRLLSCITDDDLARAREAVERAYAQGQMSVEAKIKNQQGVRTFHFVARRLQIENDLFLVGTGYDITEQKQMETQLLRAQRQQTIGTLASGIAHDLNNILAPLLAGLPILRDEIARKDVLHLLDLMENSIHRGADIVKQLLIYGRGGQTQRLPLNPIRQIQEVAKIINETFPKNLRLETSSPASTWSISADPTQIYQVLLNLAVNARDAMPDGGTITMTAENVTLATAQPSISPRAVAGDYVALTVADTGSGMPPDVLDRIFEPFFTTKEIGKGTGMGLAVVIGVVENHGGFVNVQSRIGEGTEFKIYFPALPSLTETKIASPTSAVPRGNGELILIVDDEPAILKVTSKILEKNGYQTLTANSGAEALAIYGQNAATIKVVVTDLSMPGMDGLSLASALMNSHPQAKIIIATGLGDTLDPAKLNKFGIKQVLKKPFTSEAILTALRQNL